MNGYNNNWIIYYKINCPYSILAKDLLDNNNIKYKLIKVDSNNKYFVLNNLKNKIKDHTTFPIIFNNNKFIGGYDNLNKYFDNGKRKNNFNIEPIIFIPYFCKTFKYKKFKGGSPDNSLHTLNYIKSKFPNACIVSDDNIITHEDLSLRYIEEKKSISIPKHFWDNFYSCLNNKSKFIIFPFGFTCKDSGHANIMIYNKQHKSLERFEPYGLNLYSIINDEDKSCFIKNIDNKIKQIFLNKNLINTYYSPKDMYNIKGLQYIQEKEDLMNNNDPAGYCTMWSLFYCDLRLSNPHIENQSILLKNTIKFFKNSSINLTDFIRNYTNFIFMT